MVPYCPFFLFIILLQHCYVVVSNLLVIGHFETVARNSNQVSRVQLRRPQEQMSSFISSCGIAKDQSSLQVNVSVFEHGSQTNTYPSPHSHVGRDTHTKKSTTDISVDKIKPKPVQISGFHAHDIEETLIDVSVTEVPGPISFHERAQSVADPKTLQHVANALHYMAESQTTVDDTKVKSRSSDFTKSLVHTLEAINKKHGDITRDCSLESDCIRTFVLLGVCKVVKDLEKKRLKDLDVNSLGSYYTAVRDAENVKLNVQWLRRRLDEIRDACNLSDEAKGLKNERDRLAGNIDRKRQEISACRVQLEKLKSEVHYIKDQLALDLEMVEELNYEMSKWSRFQHANLMDGLI